MRGSDLRAMRRDAGMTQAELADAIGMTRETVGLMERDQAPIEKRTELAVRYVVHVAAKPTRKETGDG